MPLSRTFIGNRALQALALGALCLVAPPAVARRSPPPATAPSPAFQPAESLEGNFLAAYIAGPVEDARPVARKLRAGTVNLNYPDWDTSAPFGGYKQSGNGREYADWGIHDFCEVKGIVGYGEA